MIHLLILAVSLLATIVFARIYEFAMHTLKAEREAELQQPCPSMILE
jgi:hypothetical protein